MRRMPSILRELALAAALAVALPAATRAAPDTSAIPALPPETVQAVEQAQPDLLRPRLQALAPSRPDVTDLYFLGVAGFAHQDVFMREVRFAARLFDRRFDTTGRSLALINNPATLRDEPLASLANLRAALRGISRAMDTRHDVLFLFMTSHGSPDLFSTQFAGFEAEGITPAELSSALYDAGIKWRAIVISACYSGSFIKALRNDHTLIITAARSDRPSFGCTNEATFTYFGRAFLDEALRRHSHFVEAFDAARDAVAAREQAEDLTPSEPQIHVGRNMAGKLRELAQRAAAEHANASR